MNSLADLLRSQIANLEAVLSKGERHECRFCLWFDCSDKCHCGCGQVSKERRLHLDGLKALAECIDNGEVPVEDSDEITISVE